jgi:hypothetical protein
MQVFEYCTIDACPWIWAHGNFPSGYPCSRFVYLRLFQGLWLATFLRVARGADFVRIKEVSSDYTPLAVVSLRVSTTATNSANSGCFVERGRCDRRCTRHAKITSGSSLTSDTWIIAEQMKSQLNWNNQIIEIQISIVRVSEHLSKMLVLSGVFNTRILDATKYANQEYMRVNYILIVVYSMLLATGSQSRNVSCFCLDMAQLRSLIGQSLCNAIYWSNMGFSVYWCSCWYGRIEYIETTAYGVQIRLAEWLLTRGAQDDETDEIMRIERSPWFVLDIDNLFKVAR